MGEISNRMDHIVLPQRQVLKFQNAHLTINFFLMQ